MDTEQIKADLAAGLAILRYIKTDEAWYASGIPRHEPGVIESWSVGIDSVDGGTYGEWTINFVQIGNNLSARHEIYGDALPALLAAPYYLEMIRATDGPGDERIAVEAALKSLGFKDMTQRTDPNLPAQAIRDANEQMKREGW
jgi:hypothetical protein